MICGTVGVCALMTSHSQVVAKMTGVVAENNQTQDKPVYSSQSSLSHIEPIRKAFDKYVYGMTEKTKRSLAEEAESGDDNSLSSWIIRDGCCPNELDNYGYTPLLNASVAGRVNAVNELIKNGADVNKKGPYGFTPLHAAAQNGRREIVFALLHAGADINALNDDQDAPLHLAIRSNRIEIVNLLTKLGADVKCKGYNGKCCVQTAQETGMTDMARSLKNYNASMGSNAKPAMGLLNLRH